MYINHKRKKIRIIYIRMEKKKMKKINFRKEELAECKK
jgi:hypothetical protein